VQNGVNDQITSRIASTKGAGYSNGLGSCDGSPSHQIGGCAAYPASQTDSGVFFECFLVSFRFFF
jgi:hypothetical protein